MSGCEFPGASARERRGFELAYKVALEAPRTAQVRVGAVAVRAKTWVACCNMPGKTHPEIARLPYERNAACHAEFRVTRHTMYFQGGWEMFVVRVGKRGEVLPSRPCKGCMGAIQWSPSPIRGLLGWISKVCFLEGGNVQRIRPLYRLKWSRI